MKIHALKTTLFSAAALMAANLSASAVEISVPIENAGFELPPLNDGANQGLPYWDFFGTSQAKAALNPTVVQFGSGVPEGYNVGAIAEGPAYTGMSQTLQGATGALQADATYTLKVHVGEQSGNAYNGYIIQLVCGGVVLAQDDNSKSPDTGSFLQTTITYNYNAALHSGLVGQPLEIRLLSKGLNYETLFSRSCFDNVQLTLNTSNAIADPSGPYRLTEGDPLNLDGSNSIPGDGGSTITTYEWDLDNDGSYGAADGEPTGATPAAISYATLTGTHGLTLGENTIGLRVTDDNSNVATSTTTVTIYGVRTFTGPNTSRGGERWNIDSYWNSGEGFIPEGFVDVIIPDSKLCLGKDPTQPQYSGNLYLGVNSQLTSGWPYSRTTVSYNVLGTPGQTIIYMDQGSQYVTRVGESPTIPEIVLQGNGRFDLGTSTGPGAKAKFDYPISGPHTLILSGNRINDSVANLNRANTFSALSAVNRVSVSGNVAGSLGLGNVTISGQSRLYLNASGAINSGAVLNLSSTDATRLTINADNTCAQLIVGGVAYPAGTYGSSSSSAENKYPWIAGSYILTVEEAPSTYWDINGATAGAGGASPSGTWGATAEWTTAANGDTATNTWISGSTAAFAAGSDATGSYNITVGKPSGISITKQDAGNESYQAYNLPPTNFSTTLPWSLDGGNAVVVLFSAINAETFTATYDGVAMTVVGALSGTRNAYSGIAYIINPVSSTGDVVINAAYDTTYSGGTNTGGYANFGLAYSVLSLKGVASAGTPATKSLTNGERYGSTLTYSTTANNSFVLGVGSDNNWRSGTKNVTGICSNYLYQGGPGYYNTTHAYGIVPAGGTYNDIWEGQLTSMVTIPLEAAPVPNSSYNGQTISGLRFEDNGTVTLSGERLNLVGSRNVMTVTGTGIGNISTQLTGNGKGIKKRGSGTLILSDPTNNYTGLTEVGAGTLQLGASNVIPAASDVIIAGETAGSTATLDLNNNSESVGNLTLGGETTTSGATVTTGTGTLTLGTGGVLEYSGFYGALGASIAGNLAITDAAHSFFIGDSLSAVNDLTISAAISGSTAGFSKDGYGTLLLSGNNTYTGATTVEDGTLVLTGSDNSLATGGITVNSGGILGLGSPGSINGTAKNLTINSRGIVYFEPSFLAGNIPAALNTRIVTASTGVVAADNYTGTNFNFNTSGVDVFLGAVNTLSYTGTITPDGTNYRIGGGTGAIILPNTNAVTGANSLEIGGDVILTGSNDLSGATTISAGLLQLGNGGTTGSLASSAITNNSVLIFNRSDTQDQGTHFQTPITGSGVVAQAGTGTLILDGANTYSGGTSLLAGGLVIGNDSGIGTGPLNILAGTLDVTAGGVFLGDINNNLLLQGSFSYLGTDDITFEWGKLYNYGNHTITLGGSGVTFTVDGGASNQTDVDQTLTVNGAGNKLVLAGYEMSTVDIDFYPNGTNVQLTIDGTADVDITDTITDWSLGFDVALGSLIKNGSGTLTLYGFNDYTGQTVVNAGILDYADGGQDSDFIINSGGTLGLNTSTTVSTTGSLTLEPGHAVKVTLDTTPVTGNEYILMTANDGIFAIAPTLSPLIPGWELEIQSNNLVLVEETPLIPAVLDIVDNKSGGPVVAGELVTYTVTFDRDIDDTTMTSADFTNAGSSAVTFGSITETGANTGVFTVEVTPTSAGTLQLRLPSGAKITPQGGAEATLDNNVDDNTVIQVEDYWSAYMAWSGDVSFTADGNGDGVANGLAWILGLDTLNSDLGEALPTIELDDIDNPDFATFRYPVRRYALDVGADPQVRYTSDLSSWTTALDTDPDVNITTYTDAVATGIDMIEVNVRRTLAVDGKMFFHLWVMPPTAPE